MKTNQARELIQAYGKARINTLTKYPSILTYHQMGERGMLTETLTTPFAPGEDAYIAEKVDGTNVCIVLMNDGSYLIGSRDNLIHCSGDLYYATDMGIVDSLRQCLDFHKLSCINNAMMVLYGELYGGKINGGKIYGTAQVKFRLFDVAGFYQRRLEENASYSLSELSRWREHNLPGGSIEYGQPFLNKNLLIDYAQETGLPLIPVAVGPSPPGSIADTFGWLSDFRKSQFTHDLSGTGDAEGVVISNFDRSKIVKLRFEDYTKTIKRNP